jgi:hypothetical protein
VWWGISPLWFSGCGDRVFPAIFKAYSDQRHFLRPDSCGIPASPPGVERASHGLFHLDHRLLGEEAQEMSILASCALVSGSPHTAMPCATRAPAAMIRPCRVNGSRLIWGGTSARSQATWPSTAVPVAVSA